MFYITMLPSQALRLERLEKEMQIANEEYRVAMERASMSSHCFPLPTPQSTRICREIARAYNGNTARDAQQWGVASRNLNASQWTMSGM
jgi:hypothetical protein